MTGDSQNGGSTDTDAITEDAVFSMRPFLDISVVNMFPKE